LTFIAGLGSAAAWPVGARLDPSARQAYLADVVREWDGLPEVGVDANSQAANMRPNTCQLAAADRGGSRALVSLAILELV